MKKDTLEEHIPTSVVCCRDGEYSFRIEGNKDGTYFAISDTRPLRFCIELPTKAEAEQEARDAIASHREFKAKERQRAKHFAGEQVFHAS